MFSTQESFKGNCFVKQKNSSYFQGEKMKETLSKGLGLKNTFYITCVLHGAHHERLSAEAGIVVSFLEDEWKNMMNVF